MCLTTEEREGQLDRQPAASEEHEGREHRRLGCRRLQQVTGARDHRQAQWSDDLAGAVGSLAEAGKKFVCCRSRVISEMFLPLFEIAARPRPHHSTMPI